MKTKRIKNKLPPFVPMTWKMLRSQAYWKLPSSAAKVLPYFIGQVQVPYGDPARYETNFSLTYSEAKSLGIGKTTFHKDIKALMAFGFIDPVKKGGLRSFGNTKSIFKLSRRWEIYGTAAFKERNWDEFPYDQKRRVNHEGSLDEYGKNSQSKKEVFTTTEESWIDIPAVNG